MKLGIVIADFNREITSRMEKKALEIAKKLKVKVDKKINVPGTFEIPIMVKKLLCLKEDNGLIIGI